MTSSIFSLQNITFAIANKHCDWLNLSLTISFALNSIGHFSHSFHIWNTQTHMLHLIPLRMNTVPPVHSHRHISLRGKGMQVYSPSSPKLFGDAPINLTFSHSQFCLTGPSSPTLFHTNFLYWQLWGQDYNLWWEGGGDWYECKV